MKNKAFDIFIRLKGYFFNPDKMWRNIDEKERTNSFVKMVLPLFPAVILSMIVGQVIFAEFDFEKLTVGVLLMLLSMHLQTLSPRNSLISAQLLSEFRLDAVIS